MNPDTSVRELLRRGFVSSVFQPIADLNSGDTAGYEALMRGPSGTLLERPDLVFGPDSPLSRETLLELDFACVSAALRAGHLLAERAHLFINLEMETLLHSRPTLLRLEHLLTSCGIPPHRIVFELSERGRADTPQRIAEALRELCHAIGAQVALDDLGSAYSGLHHLLWFEPAIVKLDMALIKGLSASPRKQAMVRHLAAMADDLGCEIVAEGVDTQADLLLLMEYGIRFAQGYHFGRPREAGYWRDAPHPFGFQSLISSSLEEAQRCMLR